jgi:hypothetical protein
MSFEKLNIGLLIEDNIKHILYELTQPKPIFFRVAREAHQLLYRSMIKALTGSNRDRVTGRGYKDKSYRYKLGEDPWMEIKPEKVIGCKTAWRYSSPKLCEEPIIPNLTKRRKNEENFLISFWDSLAMVQAEPFMHQLVDSKPLEVPDEDMRVLEWLHEMVRNEFEHFIPKLYLVSEDSLLKGTKISIEISQKLLFETGLMLEITLPEQLIKFFQEVKDKVDKINAHPSTVYT